MSESSERTGWDERHRGKPVGAPEPFLVEMIPQIPQGIALDVAAGRGRNAIAMARAGIRVVAVDFSETAMHALAAAARAERLAVWPVVANLDSFHLKHESLDAIININFLDRGSLAAAAPAIASELFLSPTKLGVLLSAFSWTYPPFLLIAGWAVDRYSVKWVFAAGFLLWSLATLASGLTHSFNMLLALRLLLGIGESVAYPAYSKLVASGFREQARGFVNSLLDTGSKIGPGLAILIGGLMVARFGWRALFWTMGAASLLWLIPWIIWAPSDAGRRAGGGVAGGLGAADSAGVAIASFMTGGKHSGKPSPRNTGSISYQRELPN